MTLSANQMNFIANRLVCASDKEAAQVIGMSADSISLWKRDPEFLAAYEASFSDGIEVAKALTRKHLGRAGQRMSEALDATKTIAVEATGEYEEGRKVYVPVEIPDHKARLDAAKLLFQAHGMLIDRVQADVNANVNTKGYTVVSPDDWPAGKADN